MNGHTLDTLREMSQKEKIPPSVAMPIMFGAMADMTAAITAIGKNQEDSKNEREKMSDDMGRLSDDMQGLSDKIDCQTKIVDELKSNINKNPAIKMGTFIQNYRSLSIFLGVLVILFLTAWSIPGVRIGFFEWIGMPDSWIVFLNP